MYVCVCESELGSADEQSRRMLSFERQKAIKVRVWETRSVIDKSGPSGTGFPRRRAGGGHIFGGLISFAAESMYVPINVRSQCISHFHFYIRSLFESIKEC